MNDGGSMITNYIVEKCDLPGGDWTVYTKTRFTYITIERAFCLFLWTLFPIFRPPREAHVRVPRSGREQAGRQ